jgi:CRP-like cAMP-binding protein
MPMRASIADIGAAAILAGLPTALSSRLFAAATPHHVRAGEALFRAGDKGDGCYRLQKGLLKVTIISPEGEELILSFISAGDMVGELAVIDGLPRSATAVAVKDSDLSFISRTAFEEATNTQPALYRGLVEVLAARLRETNEALAAASFMNAQARVARAVLELAELLGEDAGEGRIVIAHPIRQSDLAAMAGIARENVSRILSDWKRRMIVTRLSQRYCVNDPAALKRELED